MAQTVAVIDYGMGNLHSAASALQHAAKQCDSEVKVVVSSDPTQILAADRVLFPGVGAIRDCMAEIRRLGMDQVVTEAIASKPVLAICVGMQALMQHSEENDGVDCLGILPGQVKFFGKELRDDSLPENQQRLKVPHMGWDEVAQTAHPLWEAIPDNGRFYFVHSYYVRCDDVGLIAGEGNYGVNYDAALAKDNLFAVQFHPEKSAANGLRLLTNFLNWKP